MEKMPREKQMSLEALYITATGKSQRTNNYQDMIRKGTEGFEISLRLLSVREQII